MLLKIRAHSWTPFGSQISFMNNITLEHHLVCEIVCERLIRHQCNKDLNNTA